MLDAALLAGLNHLLAGANWARARLAPYAGRHACFDMAPFRFAFAVTADGGIERASDAADPDVTIRLPADTPFLLPQGFEKIMAAAHVEGNAEFATELSFVFRHLRWDVEEDLSRLVGDIAAHRIIGTADRLKASQVLAMTRFGENFAGYLANERRFLVSVREFGAFREEVMRLNTALAALENRIRP